ncbi:GNAT family N-acetyltransferase [Halobacillus sp. A5]|uniref:GNAT family N-acetyltransferase n=1 Tax=Halobacillus sp. A5 TaxID=2880263 RepID=UPI0020A61ED4|nr:GNAT family N-acetyltransferase [Halobacillus sp. A5]MCP3028493.1 N-acetyltransferase family protein [Halobacillus sp. A5]
MNENLIIEQMGSEDWEQVREIYQQGIDTGDATFEKKTPSWEEWDASHTKQCRIAARMGEKVAGWAALSPVSNRCVYAGVAEVSVYVRQNYKGKGIGHSLLEALIEQSELNGFWTLQAGLFPENIPSLKLHYKCGFREVGRRERIGEMNGVWRDTVLLERRSSKAGVNEA